MRVRVRVRLWKAWLFLAFLFVREIVIEINPALCGRRVHPAFRTVARSSALFSHASSTTYGLGLG